MEKYVCNLELAKKLKELGIKQESEFYWWNRKDIWELWEGESVIQQISNWDSMNFNFPDSKINEHYSAFTVGELGEKLPYSVWLDNDWRHLNFIKNKEETLGSNPRWCYRYGKKKIIRFADAEANVRAKMLIYLLENKLMEVSDGKEKLNV